MVKIFESSFTFGTFRLYPHESTKTFQSLLWDILRLFRWFVFVKNNNLIMIKDFLKINVSCFRNWLLDPVNKIQSKRDSQYIKMWLNSVVKRRPITIPPCECDHLGGASYWDKSLEASIIFDNPIRGFGTRETGPEGYPNRAQNS